MVIYFQWFRHGFTPRYRGVGKHSSHPLQLQGIRKIAQTGRAIRRIYWLFRR